MNDKENTPRHQKPGRPVQRSREYLQFNLEENSSRPQPTLISQSEQERRRRLRQKKVKRQRMIFAGGSVILLAILIFVIMLIAKGCSAASVLEGKWRCDEITAYEFYEDGKGALVLPSSKYEFTYTDNKDESIISIDFEDEVARDCVYTYTVNGDTLTLVSEESYFSGTYTLTRER